MHKSTRLKFELFGGPTLTRGDDFVSLSPFEAALLSVTFAEGKERLPRNHLQELLWSEPDPRTVRHSLSQLVYKTNKKCSQKVLEIEGELVRVRLDSMRCDMDDFEEMIRRPRFDLAAEMIGRGFLSAYPKPPTDAFSDWMDLSRLSVRGRLREKALSAWAVSEAVEDWPSARPAAEALLRLDPADEVVLRRVM